MRYLISKLLPVPMHSTYTLAVLGSDVRAGGHGNHFRNDDHQDRVAIRWWQWRNHCFARHTVSTCIGL